MSDRRPQLGWARLGVRCGLNMWVQQVLCAWPQLTPGNTPAGMLWVMLLT